MDYEYDRARGVARKSSRVKSISPIFPIKKTKRGEQEYQESEGNHTETKQISKLPDEALRHFDQLELEVEELQKELIEDKRPFRVEIYREGDHVLIDIYKIISSHQERKLATKDITDGDFTDWAKMIQEGEGMLCNLEG